MAETNKRLRVIIVGGSVAGLTLAHGLHQNDIDFVVLEAGKEMAPHIGASIVVLPNGLRILDQLGICDDILNMVDPLTDSSTWTKDGKLLDNVDVATLCGIRMGYPMAFLLRSELLQVIANHIPDSSKIKTSKRVVAIDHSNSDGVTVRCQDGSEFSGDIVVGADGIHSTVRAHMQQHMDSIRAGSSSKDRAGLSAEYNCIFGYGPHPKGHVVVGEGHRTYTEGCSTLVLIGKDKLFWFLFSKMDKRYFGDEIPRYTKADTDEHAKAFFDMSMTESTKFQEVYEGKSFANMLSLEELQLEHWTSDRFVCLGDASHKMTPNFGAGGNAAIESAAALTNSIAKLKPNPSLHEIRSVLQGFQDKRSPRANAICKVANELTRIEALATLPDKFIGIYGGPLLGDFLADMMCGGVVGAEKLDCLPIPERSLTATMPFDPNTGVGMQESKWLRALYALPLLGVLYGCHKTMGTVANSIGPVVIESLKAHGSIDLGGGQIVPVLAKYTGHLGFDRLLRLYTAIFTPFIGGFDPVASTQAILFLADLIPVQAIWMIEGIRRGNFITASHLLPTIFGILYQLKGIGFIGPIYFFLHYVQSPLENYAAADNRMVQVGPAKTIIPTLILSYIIPTVAMFTYPGVANRQWINAIFWQPFPIYAALSQKLLSYFVTDTTKHDRKYNPEADMPYLRRTYAFAGGAAALTYIVARLVSPVSITEALFTGIRSPSASFGLIKDATRLFRYDQIACFSAGAIWTLLNFGDLKRKNKIQASWAKIIGVFGGVTLLGGPGAALAAMAAWREECLPAKRNPPMPEKK